MNRLSVLVLLASGFLAGHANAADEFSDQVRPFFETYCFACHDADVQKSGVRLDVLSGKFADKHLRLWTHIRDQLADQTMPPDDQPQPSQAKRGAIVAWIDQELKVAKLRVAQNNGSVRRLTVPQYRETLQRLLGIKEDLTDTLPPDAVSRDGFTNNASSMVLSPLQVESYFDIAAKALDQCIVDPNEKPTIQNFRVDFGKAINPQPYVGDLILGAGSKLLQNDDFVVTELAPEKPFEFNPFVMQTKYRFHEGYQGNSTVRGWRDYDSIYHAVFACVRGNGTGYPKGSSHEVIPAGLVLRPAIPSRELFGIESTYGPKANFKIALRELPRHGNFRITVNAAKYDDGLLLDRSAKQQDESALGAIVVDPDAVQSIDIEKSGIYQVDVHLKNLPAASDTPDDSKLQQDLIGRWAFDQQVDGVAADDVAIAGSLVGNAKTTDSPFGKSLSVNGGNDAAVYPRTDVMDVGKGDFSVAAWIHPDKLAQGGIVCLGKYSWTHGWYFDMPNDRGVLRIETAGPNNQSNGTVASRPNVIRAKQWQHVAAVVRRGESQTRLYVNGFEVAKGEVGPANLDNPNVDLHIGRIQASKQFYGQIDEVRMFRRALEPAEIQALVEPGRRFVQPPTPEKPQPLLLELGDRYFTGTLSRSPFLAVRLPVGKTNISAKHQGQKPVGKLVLTPLSHDDPTAQQFTRFEKQIPRLGVHLGLRRDCGHTFRQIDAAKNVKPTDLTEFRFEGAINDYPSPDVQKDNDNYLAGVREIVVHSEYTDGRDMPRLLIRSVEFEGPLYETWPPATHQNIFLDSPNQDDPQTYAREIIHSFATRAFRRPLRTAEENALMDVWRDSFDASADFRQSIKDALLVTLTSPQFLHLIEESETPKPETLDDYELASKLSYFLWNGPPDETLLDLAANGKLNDRIDSQIDRMIDHARFEGFTDQFSTQWLQLGKVDSVEFDIRRYPNLRREVIAALKREPGELLLHLIRNNLPARELVQSENLMVNEITAKYYGVKKPVDSGFDFVPVAHQSPNLGGLLSQAGVLAGLSDGRESNPVKRGAWLARKIVAEPPEDPPPNVPALEEDLTKLSLRERLEKHRNQDGCVKCHLSIDPWGVPLEEFDAAGLFKKKPADAKSTLPDKTEVAGVAELKTYLAEKRLDQVAFSVLKHLATYAIGRDLSYNEIESLRQKTVDLRDKQYRMREMVRFIVHSDLFMKK